MNSSLAQSSSRELEAIFEAARDDPGSLQRLNEELKRRHEDEDLELQLKVVTRIRQLAKGAPKPVQPRPTGPVRGWLSAFLIARNLLNPDARPLFQYRMSDAEYAAARRLLEQLHREGRLVEPDSRAGRLFVLFCAEWFRRDSRSTALVWNDIAPEIFQAVPWTAKKALTEHGLRYWERQLRRSTVREFLLTLALEGGFPVRILAEGGEAGYAIT